METIGNTYLWVGFNVVVAVLLAIDIGVLHRKVHVVSPREATGWTLAWITLSLGFCGGIWWQFGSKPALEFLTGYVIEYSLSVDNLFVFLVVFGYFKVKPEYRHKLLFWGILGAVFMRAILILVGTALAQKFDWVFYIFGAFLIYTAYKMLTSGDEEIDPSHNPVLKLAHRVLRIAPGDHGDKFFVRQNGSLLATNLFLVLLVVETTDLIFALDSIPAVMGISTDPFIIYSSNVAAILGLRSLFFVVAALMDKFHYLKIGLAFVLGFVGVKMLINAWYHVPIVASLAVIVGILGLSIAISLLRPKKHDELTATATPPAKEEIGERPPGGGGPKPPA